MNVIFVLVVGFPMGYLITRRSLAVLTFLAADSFLFTFQTLDVLLNWMSGEAGMGGAKAFGEFPTGLPLSYDQPQVLSYGLVNGVLLLAGIGLTVLGNWLRARHSQRTDAIHVG